jgi:hypothetical protein
MRDMRVKLIQIFSILHKIIGIIILLIPDIFNFNNRTVIIDVNVGILIILADGITYSFGIFLVELITVFEADRGAVSLIPSILVGVTLGSGKR